MRSRFLAYRKKIKSLIIEGWGESGIELKVLMLGGPRGWDVAHIRTPIGVPRGGH